jgi:hypothetical protein
MMPAFWAFIWEDAGQAAGHWRSNLALLELQSAFCGEADGAIYVCAIAVAYGALMLLF